MFRALTSATSAAASTGTRGFFVSFDAMRFTTSFDPVKTITVTARTQFHSQDSALSTRPYVRQSEILKIAKSFVTVRSQLGFLSAFESTARENKRSPKKPLYTQKTQKNTLRQPREHCCVNIGVCLQKL